MFAIFLLYLSPCCAMPRPCLAGRIAIWPDLWLYFSYLYIRVQLTWLDWPGCAWTPVAIWLDLRLCFSVFFYFT